MAGRRKSSKPKKRSPSSCGTRVESGDCTSYEEFVRQGKLAEQRRELGRRLKKCLEDEGYVHWQPSEGKVKPDDVLSVELTCEELAEIVGALDDAIGLEMERREARLIRKRWEQLEEALTGANNVRAVLRDFGLGDVGRRDRVLHRRLRMAVDFCRLTRSGPTVVSYESELKDAPRVSRAFGEVLRGVLSGASQPLDVVYPAPISTVEAVRVIERWYDHADVLKAREGLIEAREALREHPKHPLVYQQFPPPEDDFEIPNELTLERE